MRKSIADSKFLSEWHMIKNNNLKPENVSYMSHQKIWWLCKMGHEWIASCNNRTRDDSNCPYCTNKKVCKDNCLMTIHPNIALEWHKTKNDLTPYDVTYGSDKKVWWKCPVAEDHEWFATICSRTRKTGGNCPFCKNKRPSITNSLGSLFPEIAAEFHQVKNSDLNPNEILYGTDKKYWWVCKKGHEWQASPNNRTNQLSGCPICNLSKGEQLVKSILEKHKINYTEQYPLPYGGKADFAVKVDNKIKIIEYNGIQHYRPVAFDGKKETAFKNLIQNLSRDHKKANWCEENKTGLLTIGYWEKDIAESLILSFIGNGKIKHLNPPKEVAFTYFGMRYA